MQRSLRKKGGDAVKSCAQYVREKLMETVKSLGTLKNMYVRREGKDFTRNRKLRFETVIKLILEMEGRTLGHELRHYFSFSLDMPSVSAFVQRRRLILSDAFLYLFHTFNFVLSSEKRFEGYRLVACDGTHLNIARNPNDKETFFQSNPGEKGFNRLHLNALYDLCSKRYCSFPFLFLSSHLYSAFSGYSRKSQCGIILPAEIQTL